MIYSVQKCPDRDVQLHTAECHSSFTCKCHLGRAPYLQLQQGEILVVLDEFHYATHPDLFPKEIELYSNTWSFLVILRGEICSICFSRYKLKLKEIECSLPTTALSSDQFLQPTAP